MLKALPKLNNDYTLDVLTSQLILIALVPGKSRVFGLVILNNNDATLLLTTVFITHSTENNCKINHTRISTCFSTLVIGNTDTAFDSIT